jgi:hypothetical protein
MRSEMPATGREILYIANTLVVCQRDQLDAARSVTPRSRGHGRGTAWHHERKNCAVSSHQQAISAHEVTDCNLWAQRC